MKKTITISASILTLLIATATLAQPPWMDHGMAPERHLDRRIERMTEQLALTAEQQTDIRAILEAQHAQRSAQRDAVREQIDAVLTEEQRAQRDAQIDQRKARRAARMTKHLDLSPEQQTELQALMAEQRDNPSWSREEMREQLATVLTEEQLAQLEEMRPRLDPGRRRDCRN